MQKYNIGMNIWKYIDAALKTEKKNTENPGNIYEQTMDLQR